MASPEKVIRLSDDTALQENGYVVYPAYGVGRITGIHTDTVAGLTLDVVSIHFEGERMTVKVPLQRLEQSGMRSVASEPVVQRALQILSSRPRIRRAMWARRAQEYQEKIHSGNLAHLAEVIRDLFKEGVASEQSYSERYLFEISMQRICREFMVVFDISNQEAEAMVLQALEKKTLKEVA